MKIADADILILAGLGNSNPGHWQRRWLEKMKTARWVEQEDWNKPDPALWVQTIADEINTALRPVVCVTHSLGGLCLVKAAPLLEPGKVRGAFIVAPPDPDQNKQSAKDLPGFEGIPTEPLPFPSLLIASQNDPYCSFERAGDLANAWGSEFHDAGESGHINVAAGFGLWPEGLMSFTRLMQRI